MYDNFAKRYAFALHTLILPHPHQNARESFFFTCLCRQTRSCWGKYNSVSADFDSIILHHCNEPYRSPHCGQYKNRVSIKVECSWNPSNSSGEFFFCIHMSASYFGSLYLVFVACCVNMIVNNNVHFDNCPKYPIMSTWRNLRWQIKKRTKFRSVGCALMKQ